MSATVLPTFQTRVITMGGTATSEIGSRKVRSFGGLGRSGSVRDGSGPPTRCQIQSEGPA